ncbi:MAG TPA: hypothetical protein VMW41_01250 [Candidatus Bathyarchaeia archaeon]|nr:hypothetical protein [Candidatus Bathyarchaeia archaeon]
MKKKRISQETLNLAIITLITVLVWAGFDIYRAYTETKVKLDVRQQLNPLNPKLDIEVIDLLSGKRQISLEEIKQAVPQLEAEETEEKIEEEVKQSTGSATRE